MTAWDVWEFVWPWAIVIVLLLGLAAALALVAWIVWLFGRAMFGADNRSARGD